MELDKVEMIPGVITDVDDPEKLGRVKCAAVGLFDERTMDKDVLPWVMPMNMGKYQMFSAPEVGRKVWIVDNKDNENEFWYIPMFDYIDITENLVKEKYDNDLDILVSRKTSSGAAQFYYTSTDGFVIKYDNWKIALSPEGNISIHGQDGDIELKGGHLSIGRSAESGAYEPAVKGEQLKKVFKSLANGFNQLLEAAQDGNDNPKLMPAIDKLKTACYNAANGAYGICAKNVSVN